MLIYYMQVLFTSKNYLLYLYQILLYIVRSIIKQIRKVINMETINTSVVYDDITNYGITIINNVIYLIKDNKRMRLDALIIKEREVKA